MIYVATLSRRAARNASRDEEVRKKAAAVAEKNRLVTSNIFPNLSCPPLGELRLLCWLLALIRSFISYVEENDEK